MMFLSFRSFCFLRFTLGITGLRQMGITAHVLILARAAIDHNPLLCAARLQLLSLKNFSILLSNSSVTLWSPHHTKCPNCSTVISSAFGICSCGLELFQGLFHSFFRYPAHDVFPSLIGYEPNRGGFDELLYLSEPCSETPPNAMRLSRNVK